MKQTTASFDPALLILAREAEGLTQGAVAHHAGISQALLSRIENGFEPDPQPDVLAGCADICNVPVDFFFQRAPVGSETLFDIFHKKRLTLPQKPLKKATANAQMSRLELFHLLRTIDVPATQRFPFFPIDQIDSPEEAAQLTRAVWKLPAGPLPDLVEMVEATGTPVIVTDLVHEKLRAISLAGVRNDNPHVIALNGRLPASAQRFALAHEIGHLVMHEDTAAADLEEEADRFASELLMPAREIAAPLTNVKFRDLGQLKRRWRVSLASLIYRAHALGLITDRHYRTLNMELNKLPNGRKREPGEFPQEEPRLVKQVVRRYMDELEYSVDDLCRLMHISADKLTRVYIDDAPSGPQLRVLRSV